ncbi:MAG: GMC family oxidoreductase N-terminal domain-containing protein, partial [Sphingobium sp.]|nr:GMC family oxidoreductase N-terminal domain-containing protein [Sphingobium sp.]
DYDDWAALGLEGWGFDEVLTYFKRLETSWRGEGPFHGGSGPVRISRMTGPDLLWDQLRAAAEAAGIPHNDDANGAVQDGISPMESNVGDGLRSSTARAYLRHAMARPNLDIVTGALARRILVSGGRATGVEYLRGSRIRTVQADREIVLCGGAYGSPQLLMLSGIGAADELSALGIAPVHDLPGVGRDLADHPNIINEYALAGDEGLTRHLRADRAAFAALRWFASHTGPFAYTGTAANVFAGSVDGLDRPDIQMMCLPISGQAKLWWPGLQRKPVSKLSVRTGFLQPRSRGWVKLRSADPRDAPRIFNNMFAEPGDLDAMVRALRLSRSIYAQSPLREMIDRECLPGAGLQSDADLEAHIRANATHRSHPVGTCRMGADDAAVVDAELRLRGIAGLRIADASIMPSIVGGNTNLPVMMIGEKAADLIRGVASAP